MITLQNVDLLSLQTSLMKNDPTTQALCTVLNDQFRSLAEGTKLVLIYSSIDTLDNEALDTLAWQMHIDWYDATVDISIKRQLIKKSLIVHKYRGTVYAVEEVLKDYFEDAEIKEWFEYGGSPYMFKVIVRNAAVSGELAAQFTKVLNSVKNVRSHLEDITYGLFCSDSLYCSDTLIII